MADSEVTYSVVENLKEREARLISLTDLIQFSIFLLYIINLYQRTQLIFVWINPSDHIVTTSLDTHICSMSLTIPFLLCADSCNYMSVVSCPCSNAFQFRRQDLKSPPATNYVHKLSEKWQNLKQLLDPKIWPAMKEIVDPKGTKIRDVYTYHISWV